MTGRALPLCPTFYAIVDATTGEVLNVTQRALRARQRSGPGRVVGRGQTAEAAKADAWNKREAQATERRP